MIRYPTWMPDWFYRQMTNEVRTEKGWENSAKRRNEVFDLTYYALAIATRGPEKGAPFALFDANRIDWDDPPNWAAEWDENPFVFSPEEDTGENGPVIKSSLRERLEQLGKSLA